MSATRARLWELGNHSSKDMNTSRFRNSNNIHVKYTKSHYCMYEIIFGEKRNKKPMDNRDWEPDCLTQVGKLCYGFELLIDLMKGSRIHVVVRVILIRSGELASCIQSGANY